MNTRVLVLNQDFSPLMVCSVERAFILVYLNKSELVRPANGYRLNTVTRSFQMPSVIRLNRYVNAPYKGVNLTRQNIFKRDNNECQYCGTRRDLTLDHVIPSSKGGQHSWTNLVTACKKCNARKGDNTPEAAGMLLKRKPYKPSYALFLRDVSGFSHNEWDEFLESKASA
ncbi:MAG: HNH endonuclease [Cytophagales bacterium]|jgi:5-methylcytosine-specific restriction endonuclease McrA|nr:HNH endonuclease [Cytophagales bacterium]MCA6367838.1 HNH endonuclease [Cytophagales bacterium]MCA6371013.1 HNH endonuclease [Cytophagales bacterium]MCA6377159.1 HNH endonuclease [Cytophagales bacterium]MCA6384676.1 HNH endonuclease [Cytophagales bacterium]